MEQPAQKSHYPITIFGAIVLLLTCFIALQIVLEKISHITVQIIITFIISLIWLPLVYFNFKQLQKSARVLNLIILILVLLIFFIVHYNLYRLFY